MKKRIAFYTLFDPKGDVQAYNEYYIKSLFDVASVVCVIVNGFVKENAIEKIKQIPGVLLLKRENVGYDFAAWKEGIERISFPTLENYDEIILTNCSCYGPIFPFSDSFDLMDIRECDFWGYTEHREVKNLFKRHLQSYFLVIRKSLFSSSDFKDWIKQLSPSQCWQDEVFEHEVTFTHYFEKLGYVSDVFCKINSIEPVNPTILKPLELLNNKVPLVKRKLFKESYAETKDCSTVFFPRASFEFIKSRSKYDYTLITRDLLANSDISLINKNIGLINVIDDSIIPPNCTSSNKLDIKVSAFIFVYYEDQFEYMVNYIRFLPKFVQLNLASSKKELLQRYKKRLLSEGYTVSFIEVENRGRDVAASLISARHVFDQNDLILFLKDKKTRNTLEITVDSFRNHLFQCTVNSENYVHQVIDLFKNDPQLGLIIPPPVNFGPVATIGVEWAGNKDIAQQVCELLSIKMTLPSEIIAPYGSVFWIRSSAAKSILSRNWTIDDFPKEPLPNNGTINHAIERLWSILAQRDGFYTLMCIPKDYSSIYFTYQLSLLRENILAKSAVKGSLASVKNISWSEILRMNRYFISSKIFSSADRRRRYRDKFKMAIKSLIN